METVKTYHFVFDMLSENKPDFISGLTEEQQEAIQGIDQFEYFRYELCNDHVTVFDSWDPEFGNVIGFDSFENIIRNTLELLGDYE